MSVSNLKELKALRRNLSKAKSSQEIEILIGMGTCGLAAGALETFHAINDFLKEEKIDNVNVVPVGCVGMCHSEPTVQITIPGGNPTIYGNISASRVPELLETTFAGETVYKHLLTESFQKVVV